MLFSFWNVVHRGFCYIEVVLLCGRDPTTTAALGDKMCVFMCFVSVGMPGGNCSMSGMLPESGEGNAEHNGSMWETLTCFACSLHCTRPAAPQRSCIDNVDKLEHAGL